MTEPTHEVNVSQVYEASFKEALSAQRNEHANKEAHWFAQYMASQEQIKQLEAELHKLREPTQPEVVS